MKSVGHLSMTLVMGACVRVRDEVELITRAPCPFSCTVINAESVKFINTAGRLAVSSASAMRFFFFCCIRLFILFSFSLSSSNAKGGKKGHHRRSFFALYFTTTTTATRLTYSLLVDACLAGEERKTRKNESRAREREKKRNGRMRKGVDCVQRCKPSEERGDIFEPPFDVCLLTRRQHSIYGGRLVQNYIET